MTTITRAYKYLAFPPDAGAAEFDLAVSLKRELWRAMIAIQTEYDARKTKLMISPEIEAMKAEIAKADRKEAMSLKKQLAAIRKVHAESAKPELLALGTWRVDRERHEKQIIAARGLHWGDYNSVVFQFHGAVAASKTRGARVYNFEAACGDCCVNQLMNGRSPGQMFSDPATRIELIDHWKPSRLKRKRNRQMARLHFTVRGARNPLGSVEMRIAFSMHRPLPPNSKVVEVRVIRSWRSFINKNGDVRPHADWFVIFVLKMDVQPCENRQCCGIAFDWHVDHGESGLQSFAVVQDKSGPREYTMEYGHTDDWLIYKQKKAAAAANKEPAAMAEVEALGRRLSRRRDIFQREFAAQIADKYGVIALQKIDLSQKGSKNHTAPGQLRLRLRDAAAARGGEVVDVAATRPKAARAALLLAKNLYLAAQKHVQGRNFSTPETGNSYEDQKDAA